MSTPAANMLATFSGLSPEDKKQLSRCIEELGGATSACLTTSCTHLISTTRFSTKAKAAKSRNIPIYHPQWVLDMGQRAFGAKSGCTNLSGVPIDTPLLPFAGAHVSITGMRKARRTEAAEAIVRLGGKYAATMTKECTHLVALVAEGDKVDYALTHNVLVVSPDWLTHSIIDIDHNNSQWCRDESEYLLVKTQSHLLYRATPPLMHTNNGSCVGGDLWGVEDTMPAFESGANSTQACFNMIGLERTLEEEGMSGGMPPRFKRAGSMPEKIDIPLQHSRESRRELKRHRSMDVSRPVAIPEITSISLDGSVGVGNIKRVRTQQNLQPQTGREVLQSELCTASDTERAIEPLLDAGCAGDQSHGYFLRDCQVHLSGFGASVERLRRMQRLLLLAGATRISQINDLVTHIVVGGYHQPDLAAVSAMPMKPTIVPVQWLVDSFQAGKMLPPYLYQLELASSGDEARTHVLRTNRRDPLVGQPLHSQQTHGTLTGPPSSTLALAFHPHNDGGVEKENGGALRRTYSGSGRARTPAIDMCVETTGTPQQPHHTPVKGRGAAGRASVIKARSALGESRTDNGTHM